MADPARLTQVLHNLLDNALRHTPAGGSIALRAGCDDGDVWLAVQDSGEGISPQDLPHVFDRFYRADLARSRATGGAGLGLAIVRAIVEAHGGGVSAASPGEPGQGSTFTLRLPGETRA
jgi:signal transduction histidine kinase